MMRSIHTVLHSWSEQMAYSWRIFALIAAVILVASHPLSALPPASVPAASGVVSFVHLPQSPALVDTGVPGLSGPQAGLHNARLVVADDNDQPLESSFAFVVFRAHATTVPPLGAVQPVPDDAGAAAPAPPPIPPELSNEGDPNSSVGRSSLLLVSLIGFVLLIGGILPGMRLHRVHTPHTAQL
jgi:hypothetical protein